MEILGKTQLYRIVKTNWFKKDEQDKRCCKVLSSVLLSELIFPHASSAKIDNYLHKYL